MNLVAYCRVSTKKTDQLNSLEAQEEFFEGFAERFGYNLIKIYTDEGLTGTRLKNRDALLELLKDSKEDSFDMVAVKDVSRLARNTVDFLKIIRDLKENKKKVLFVNYNMDTTEPSELTLTILAAIAQEESHNTSKRVKFGKNITAKKGRVPNQVYGYDKKKGENYKLYINEEEAEVVKDIYNWYTLEGKGANKIAIDLNDKGIKTKRGNKWYQNTVVRILTNEIYTGTIINCKEEVDNFLTGERIKKPEEEWFIVKNEDMRIIDDDTFKKAQNLLSDRYDEFNVTKERTSNKYIFSTLIKCKHCGYSFRRFERTYKNTYVRWVCSGRNANGMDSCPNKTVIDEPELLKALNEIFKEVLGMKSTYIETIKKEFKKIYESNNENLLSEKEYKEKISKLEKAKKKELDLYRMEYITKEELEDNMGDINYKLQQLKVQLQMIQKNISVGDKAQDILEDTFKKIKDMVVNTDNMDNVMLKRVIDKIEVDKDNNVVIFFKVLGSIGTKGTVQLSNNSTYSCTLYERKAFFQIIITVNSEM